MTNILSSLLNLYYADGREIARVSVLRVTDGVFSCEIQLHGEPEPEEITYFGYDAADAGAPSIPIRDSDKKRKGS